MLAHLFEQTDRANEAYRRLSMALRHVPDDLEIRAAMAHNRAAAGRHRDAVAALEPVEQRLAAGTPVPPERAPVVADLLILAAECDAKQNAPAERLAARYARALELAPRHRKARAALAQLAQESGRLVDAAEHTLALADLEQDPEARGRALLAAGMLFHEAAGAAAETGEETVVSASAQKILGAAFDAVQAGLALIQHIPHPVLDRRQLEAAFWTAVSRNAGIALGCLDRLLHHPDLREAKRAGLLLEGVKIALQRGEPGDPERALAYARAAVELRPDAAAPIHGLVDALRAAGAVDEIEPAVRAYLARDSVQKPPGDLSEARDRQRLLVRLADLVVQAEPRLTRRTAGPRRRSGCSSGPPSSTPPASAWPRGASSPSSTPTRRSRARRCAATPTPCSTSTRSTRPAWPRSPATAPRTARRAAPTPSTSSCGSSAPATPRPAPSSPATSCCRCAAASSTPPRSSTRPPPTPASSRPSPPCGRAPPSCWPRSCRARSSARPPGSRPRPTRTPSCGRSGPSSARRCRPRACASPTSSCSPTCASRAAGPASRACTRR
ncbi:hypothetical protein [Nannocystis pusilla]|uniref:hypothetical protein n=1 Tax=Nannocystis pusilla TaxID=889268 RepID=UPI003B80B4B5